MNLIKKGYIVRCKKGHIGIITEDEKVLTQKGHMTWRGIHLSPEKCGKPWQSRNPTIIAKSINEFTDAGR